MVAGKIQLLRRTIRKAEEAWHKALTHIPEAAIKWPSEDVQDSWAPRIRFCGLYVQITKCNVQLPLQLPYKMQLQLPKPLVKLDLIIFLDYLITERVRTMGMSQILNTFFDG